MEMFSVKYLCVFSVNVDSSVLLCFNRFRISLSLLQLVEEVKNLLFNGPLAIFVLTSGCVITYREGSSDS